MDDEMRKRKLQEQIIKKNHGSRKITARYIPQYPDSAEREYIRLINGYMKLEGDAIKKHIPELKRIIREAELNVRLDDKSDNEEVRKQARRISLVEALRQIEKIFEEIEGELQRAFDMFGLSRSIQSIAGLDEKLSIKEWKKTVKKTFGIDLFEDYYQGDFYRDVMRQWISDNVDLIKTIPHDSLGKMKQLVYENYISGKTTTNIIKEMQEQYGMDKCHAKFIARDQTAKLNAKITQKQQRDAGVAQYEWATTGDQRVRNSHKKLDGKIFSWDDPPETEGGRKCHPGEDYQCRCQALAVFDLDEFDLPV